MDLYEWAVAFVSSRFYSEKYIIKKTDFGFTAGNDSEMLYCIVMPDIDINPMLKIVGGKKVFVFVHNTVKNLSVICDNWNRLVNYPMLRLYFVNPSSRYDAFWAICPFAHDRVADKSSLRQGLRAMFNTVEPKI